MPQSPPNARRIPPPRWKPRRIAALIAFGIITVLGPLAFGAVDRAVQVVLVFVLAAGIFLDPPALLPLGRRGNIVAIVLIGVLMLKEFLPYQWFGSSIWRGQAQAMQGLEISGMHHPEPALALDAMLAALIALVWFQWVRTMAARREMRVALVWILFAAGVALAAVCILMSPKGAQSGAIYGLRPTPGWTGFGPFPNRNHTASLLSMSALVGLGCVVRAGVRRNYRFTILATGAVFVIIIALLLSKSRGGLLSLGAGLAIFCAMMLLRHRSKRTLAVVAGGVALVAAVVVIFGGQLTGRFFSADGKLDAHELRRDIWANTITMWGDAPMLGHGMDSFTALFPFYQHVMLDDVVILHPESSWLQWLCELGVIPVVLLAGLVLVLVARRIRPLFKRRGTFYLSAGALAGLAGIALHSAIDVPGHRWMTAGYALALLAVVCPISREAQIVGTDSPRTALVPLVIGVYWVLPFFGLPLAWQPVTVDQLRARENFGMPPRPSAKEWKRALRFFPLEAELHHFAAMRELEKGAPKTSEWQRHIEIAHRLVPGSWSSPMNHARAVRRLFPGLAIQYWQEAIERSGRRAPEMLTQALNETASVPGADAIWEDYIREHPALALTYARTLPDAETRGFFDLWWEARKSATAVTEEEIREFYRLARRWATKEQVEEWIHLHPSRLRDDFRQWAALLHGVGLSERAWKLFPGRVANPDYPAEGTARTRDEIEARVRVAPENTSHLAELARLSELAGDRESAKKIVLGAAAKSGAGSMFLRKAAFFLAEDGKFAEAVELMLRDQ